MSEERTPTGGPVDALAARAAAKAAKRGRVAQRTAFWAQTHGAVDATALSQSLASVLEHEAAAAPRRAFPTTNLNKWVPIGPTVTRRGQAMSRPRTSGRIRDIAVSGDGERAYAVTAKGGVWYTADGGSTWNPIGGWAGRSVNPQGNGNMFSCGSLLVEFGADGLGLTDVVMVGTGEPTPGVTSTGTGAQGGIGILVALGPWLSSAESDPWEPDTGVSQLGGLGVWRMARRPGATPLEAAAATADRVLAATTNGLYVGTRSRLPAVAAGPPPAPMQPPQPALPDRDGFTWAAYPGAGPSAPNPRDVTDVLWLSRGGGLTRIVYAVAGTGVFIDDNDGTPPTPIAALQAPAVAFANRITLAQVPGTNRIYVLAEVAGPQPMLWQIADVVATPQTVVNVPGIPNDMFGDPASPPTQAWYDHGLAVEAVGANDRIYLGGSTVMPRDDAEGEWSASLWCFETPAAAVAAVTAPAAISRRQNPPTGAGADRNGLIGNNVHADIHAIRLAGAAPNRQVWVACDGGVYVSAHAGRVNTFAARNNGLAALEPIFVGSHPTSSHFLAAGFQDNGTQIRVGDTVWEETFLGDGGGTVIHPIRSDILVTQYTNGTWNGAPAGSYADPLTRQAGNAGDTGREGSASAFYSGAAVVADSATTGRLALGTNRVWITDNLGSGAVRWRVLPYPPATTQRDPRPGGGDPPAQRTFGVPGFVNPNFVAAGVSTADQVIDMAWQNGTTLLVVFQGGLVQYTNTSKPAGTWTVRTWTLGVAPFPLRANDVMSAVAPVPGTMDFYLATIGDRANPAIETVWFFDSAAGTFTPTGLRRALDFAGPPVVQGPCDPCFALAVDPANPAHVYAGTATGVWRGIRTGAAWTWAPFMNGLPQVTVQDLEIWSDPAAAPGSPRLLRAAMQSRGLWEVDLANAEPRRTYVRVHARDDRRRFPTPMANPRLRPPATHSPPHAATAIDEPVTASPDIVVRPAWPLTTPPAFHSTIQSGNVPAYDLWTFQTAFRWLYPSCVPDGRWSDAMRDLVRFHRSVLGLSAGAFIDATLWRHVVGGTIGGVQRGVRLRQDPAIFRRATVTTDPADPLAVYRAPWQSTLGFESAATEIDLMESVLPVRSSGSEWTVFREPSTVDILLHHRDSRQVNEPQAFAALLWRHAATAAELSAIALTDIPAFLAAVLAAGAGGAAPAAPGGWTVATRDAGSALHPLRAPLTARQPRAVSIDIDLSTVPKGRRVLLLALVGSLADDPITAPVGAPVSVADLVRAWPHAAMRVVRVTDRT